MTSRERVNAALDFSGPDRIPRDLWGERFIPLKRPEDWAKVLDLFPMDFARSPSVLGPSSQAKGLAWEPGGRTDEWVQLQDITTLTMVFMNLGLSWFQE